MATECLCLTVAEAAAMLKISKNTAYMLISQGSIPSIRLGRRLIIPRRALMRMLDEADQPKAEGA